MKNVYTQVSIIIPRYETRWLHVRREHLMMTLWHLAINIVMCIPLVYTCARVISRQNEVNLHSAFDN